MAELCQICKVVAYRKYPHILGVLTHTTAGDRLWGADVFEIVHMWQQSDRAFGTVTMWF